MCFRRFAVAIAAAALLAGCNQVEESVEVDALKELDAFLSTERLVDLGPQPEIFEIDENLRFIILQEGDLSEAFVRRQDEVEVTYDVRVLASDEIIDSTYGDDWTNGWSVQNLQEDIQRVLETMRSGDERIVFFVSPEQTDESWNSPLYLGESGLALVMRLNVRSVYRNGSIDDLDYGQFDPFQPATARSEIDMLRAFEGFLDEDRLTALGDDPTVLATPSGLQYIVVEEGPDSGVSPMPYDQVSVHYDGRLAADGAKFDSSYDRGSPAVFPADRLISGWVEALGLMKPGDEWVLFIPSDLGYGATGTPGGPIPPDADLVFRVELQEVIPGTPPPPPREVDVEAWDRLSPWPDAAPDVQSTDSGLKYVVLASGEEDGINPLPSDQVVVFYEGRLADGTVFDSAFQRGAPAVFPAGGLIPGWVEALGMMRPGDRWMLNIPYNLAYGADGIPPDIPPAADLTFEVELMDVLRN